MAGKFTSCASSARRPALSPFYCKCSYVITVAQRCPCSLTNRSYESQSLLPCACNAIHVYTIRQHVHIRGLALDNRRKSFRRDRDLWSQKQLRLIGMIIYGCGTLKSQLLDPVRNSNSQVCDRFCREFVRHREPKYSGPPM